MRYLNPEKAIVVDIEADNLRDEATVVWCVCWENLHTNEKGVLTDYKEIREFFEKYKDYAKIGHNIIGYDAPVLNRLVGTRIGISSLVDTFVLSMLFSPSLKGGHSLESWGERLKFPKIDFKDFTHLSDEMIKYCQQDVSLTKRTFILLTQRMRQVNFSEKGAELEHHSWNIIQNKQKRKGFPLDYQKAHNLLVTIRAREAELKEKIHETWPPQLLKVADFSKARKKDGSFTANYDRHLEQYPRLDIHEDGTYSAYDWVEFNLGSPPQRVEKLTEAGWKPIAFTKAGNPKVDEQSLMDFAASSGNEVGTLLAKWIVINSRGNMVNTWLNAYKEETGAIHGNLWLASTLRYRHDNPNTANIPAVRVGEDGKPLLGEDGSWTYEARDCWTCGDPDRYSLVGIDAKGIQLRVLAHYLDDAAFTEAILSADPHTANQKSFGLPTRAIAKTITYAILMGAGDGRIASEADISLKEAKAAKALFFERLPGLPRLIGRLQGELRRTGRITLCDKTPVIVTSDHMVIPYLLQGDESRMMKQASIFLDRLIREKKIEAYKVGDIHDEWQFVVRNEHVEEFKEYALSVFPRAGEEFGYTVPIEGDVKVGKTWAETH